MPVKICERCGKEYNEKDSIAAYYDFFHGDGVWEADFEGENLCPDCTLEDCEIIESQTISESDAADIYMSSGEDEDYTFGYDSDDLKEHYI